MELEASIVERLQKLRQWQLEQQQRLLKHQQIQREILSQEQDCICKALELSLQELDVNESTLHKSTSNISEMNIETDSKNIIEIHGVSQEGKDYTEMINNELHVDQDINNFESTVSQESSQEELVQKRTDIDNQMKRQSKDKIVSDINVSEMLSCSKEEQEIKQFIMDGLTPLPSNKLSVSHVLIDDVPVPSPKKDFQTLLEEKLRDIENDSSEKFTSNSICKIKRPFLKKREGLSRFKSKKDLEVLTTIKRTRSASFSGNMQSDSKYSKNKSRYSNVVQPSKGVHSAKSAHCINSSRKQLCLKDVPLPKKKIRSKSESSTSVTPLKNYITEAQSTVDLNTSDFHSGTQREMEEVRIFELLEEKAENSSFCSTSSAVLAFLQQSTPSKLKKKGHDMGNNMLNIKQVSPIIKTFLNQSASKYNQAVTYATSNKDNDSYHDFLSFLNQKSFQQDGKENQKMDTNKRRHTLSNNQIQSMHTQQNSYNIAKVENDNEADVSLHVRFSEYNEYKTIGLTDTSSISTESLIVKNFSDERVWNDSLSTEVSDTETLSIPFEVPQPSTTTKTKIHINDMQEELNCERKSIGNTQEEYNFNRHKDEGQYIYHNDESEYYDSSNHSLEDEHSTLYKCNEKSLTPQKTNISQNSENSKKCLERCNNRKVNNCVNSNNDEITVVDQESKKELQESNETIFKSELLKSRLLELEQEINIFRKENIALAGQRKKLEEDHRNLRKEYVEKEKILEENIKQMEDRLQEERRKLAREKAALENRMRDSQEKAQQSKLERQEMQILKHEVEKLKDEMHVKESRWTAAQSRHKCQMRILKMENSKLKQEIEKLQSLKKSSVRNKGKSGTSSNTKAIHQINKQLNKQFIKESQKSNENSSSDSDQKFVEPMMKATGMVDIQNAEGYSNCNSNKDIINERLKKCQTSMADVARKRNLYENLIKEATSDLNTSETDINRKSRKINSEMNTVEDDPAFNVAHYNHVNSNNNVSLHIENDYVHFISPTKVSPENQSQKLTSLSSDELSSGTRAETTSSYQNSSKIDKQDVRQIQHPDGRMEYWYPNGNVKKIFPDQGVTKLMYYNGDVRETNKNGRVKYFYASTRTWHTTMPDGIEILEFAE